MHWLVDEYDFDRGGRRFLNDACKLDIIEGYSSKKHLKTCRTIISNFWIKMHVLYISKNQHFVSLTVMSL